MMAEYWERRKVSPYYRKAVDFAKQYAPHAKSVLDVGGRDCQYILWCDWIAHKVIVDLQTFPLDGVNTVQADFMKCEWPRPFDVVLCLQVLEHLQDAPAFARRLLEVGRIVIVSVPDRWPKGQCENHLHDPVDQTKIDGWMGRAPLTNIVSDKRIVAVYEGKAR